MTTQKPTKQVAALPFRTRRGRVEILLITSRETKRWIIPKGWPVEGLKDYNAARLEALEEAGVIGRMGKKSIGQFEYMKVQRDGTCRQICVQVYALKVKTVFKTWKEKDQRERLWLSAEDAASKVSDVGLRELFFTKI